MDGPYNDDDECNLINKDDFEEGKTKEIVTARATPVKSNALARKNLSTVKKSHLKSPILTNMNSYNDPHSLHGTYYQITSTMPQIGMQRGMSQTFRSDNYASSLLVPGIEQTPIDNDMMITERKRETMVSEEPMNSANFSAAASYHQA